MIHNIENGDEYRPVNILYLASSLYIYIYIALDQLIQQLQETTGGGGDLDIWAIAQHQPHFFAKDGDYYKQVVEKYGGSVPDNTHFQFREFPGKTFAFNKKKESLEVSVCVCLV